MEKLMKEFQEACEEIARECEAEGYLAYGSNYELRVEALKKSYPELFEAEEALEVVATKKFNPEDPNCYEAD